VINVPAGPATITATFPLTNQKIASLANVPVVAGTVTVVAVDPN
jgi:hypothetical protein